jgi:VIT1/CCC1 family predicted Fe2+/Mn2+ transporter
VSSQRDTEIAHGRTKDQVNARPWSAAVSSLVAFTAGAILPLVAITGPWQGLSIPATVASVLLALGFTGWWAAWAGKTPVLRSIIRNVAISALTMGISYAIGAVLGVTVI